MKNPDPVLPAWLPRLRAAITYGVLGWLVFVDLYNHAPFVGRGIWNGLVGASITLLVLKGLLAGATWFHGLFQSRWRAFEGSERTAAFRTLMETLLVHSALLALNQELRAGLPLGASAVPLVEYRFDLALAGAAWLALGSPRWTLKKALRAWAIGGAMLYLIITEQWLEGARFNFSAWKWVAVVSFTPMVLHWAFNETVWPLATKALGKVAGSILAALLFALWCVQPSQAHDLVHVLEVIPIGALGLWLTYRSRPGIR